MVVYDIQDIIIHLWAWDKLTAIVAFIISHELPDWNGHPQLLSSLTKKSHLNQKESLRGSNGFA